MKTALAIFNRFRSWRLNAWANQLLDEALYHRREFEREAATANATGARHHRMAESAFRTKARQVRELARRIKAAGQV